MDREQIWFGLIFLFLFTFLFFIILHFICFIVSHLIFENSLQGVVLEVTTFMHWHWTRFVNDKKIDRICNHFDLTINYRRLHPCYLMDQSITILDLIVEVNIFPIDRDLSSRFIMSFLFGLDITLILFFQLLLTVFAPNLILFPPFDRSPIVIFGTRFHFFSVNGQQGLTKPPFFYEASELERVGIYKA